MFGAPNILFRDMKYGVRKLSCNNYSVKKFLEVSILSYEVISYSKKNQIEEF